MDAKTLKRLALQKWRFLIKENYVNNHIAYQDLVKHNPRLKDMMSHCSYCDRYKRLGCCGCPLETRGRACCPEFYDWCRVPTMTNAKIMYDKIKAIKAKRLEVC